MGKIYDTVAKRLRAIEQAMAIAYAEGAIEGGIPESPTPGEDVGSRTPQGVVGKYATGRYQASLQVTNDTPTTYDPGPKAGTYRIPTIKDATFHVKRRRPGQSVVFSSGVPYSFFVSRFGYKAITAGHEEGIRRARAAIKKKGRP